MQNKKVAIENIPIIKGIMNGNDVKNIKKINEEINNIEFIRIEKLKFLKIAVATCLFISSFETSSILILDI